MMRLLSTATITMTLLTSSLLVAAHLDAAGREASQIESGLSVYPGAEPKPESRQHGKDLQCASCALGLRTVKLENASVRELTAAKYISSDPPEKVLSYYKNQLKSYGTAIECGAGTNTEVSVRLSNRTLSNPSACEPEDVGRAQVELKAGDGVEQHIVAVGPHGRGSEFTLVHVRAR
jgi:hypothetical protein